MTGVDPDQHSPAAKRIAAQEFVQADATSRRDLTQALGGNRKFTV